jgi:glyoxylase-like metal-dependent hydrolase (beta-lactamase superfamily II)
MRDGARGGDGDGDGEAEAEVEVEVTLRYAGACRHPEGMVVRGAPWRPATFPALFAVLRHPRHGVTLFDTGYTARFDEETAPFPARIYRWLTPVTLAQGDSAAEQLARAGVEASAIRRIILSHFHADHIAGARDFPEARFTATQEAYDVVHRAGAFGRLRRGFLPGLLPDDFERRADLLRPEDFGARGLEGIGGAHDLFGDGSVRLLPLPGHAAGQIGALVRRPGGRRQFLVADAAWTTASFRDDRPSHRAAGLIMDHAATAARTLRALHDLARRDPSLDIVPSHCAERAAVDQPGRPGAGNPR